MEEKPYLVDPEHYLEVSGLIDDILSRQKKLLGDKLVGVYVYGSLVSGDFDYETSDIDLMVAVSSDLSKQELDKLKKMHDEIAHDNNKWENKIEVAYLSIDALKTFKTQRSKIAVISPGEPFHEKEAGNDWLINWYNVREKGLTLYGPSPKTLIDPISKEEFIQGVIEQTKDWPDWIPTNHQRKFQAYAILTMCRALYSFRNGEQVSKKQAALWAQKQLPEWSPLIQNALLWREDWRNEQVDHEATFPETTRFVHYINDQIKEK